jgi:hypothetical protein
MAENFHNYDAHTKRSPFRSPKTVALWLKVLSLLDIVGMKIIP